MKPEFLRLMSINLRNSSRFFASAVALFGIILSVNAREISSDEASKAAEVWALRDAAPLGVALGSASVDDVETVFEGKTPVFHAVRFEGGGVVVTSAESGVKPVVAFLDGSDLPEDDPECPLWNILRGDLANRTEQTIAIRNAAASVKAKAANFGVSEEEDPLYNAESEWEALLSGDPSAAPFQRGDNGEKYGVSSVSDVRVPKLLETTWGQSSGAANYYTPPGSDGSSGNYVCGCVALAGAQIARFWKFPTSSRPTVTRTCYVSGSSVSKTTKGGTYSWNNMPATYSSLTTAQKQAIGKLCYDFGVATYMNWSSGGSGTGGYCLNDAFLTVFGYSNSRTYVQSGGAFSAAIIQRSILSNLDAGCPVSLGIDGHQVVADGYGYSSGTLYTHINLGWQGGGDAWYNLPTIDATSMGYTSTVLDEVIYNIFPSATGELLTGRVLDSKGNPVSGATVKAVNGSTTVSSTSNARGIYALRVAGGKTWTVTASYSGASGTKSVSVTASVSTSVDGKYYTPGTGTVGNSWGNDITLGVVAPVQDLSLPTVLDNAALTFTTGGDVLWFGQVDETHDGVDAAQSGAITDSQNSWLETTVSGPGKISFWWNVSSESVSYDYLEFLVDGVQDSKIGGTSASWAQKTVSISGIGSHTLRWNYHKDGSISSGSDCGWVDMVVWTPDVSVPAAPSSISAADGASTANCTVTWSSVSGATSYNIYRATSATGTKTTLKTGVSSTSYSDTTATPGTLYCYWVRAVNSAGMSALSTTDTGYRKLVAPAFSSASDSPTGVSLAWNAVSGATHYRVFRSTSANGAKTSISAWQTARTFTDTQGVAGTTYYYFVMAAVNSSGLRPSAYSAYKTGSKIAPPAAVSTVSATDGSSTANCTVSWGAVSGATGYVVYRAKEGVGTDKANLVASGITGTSYADATATPGVSFVYWVRAVNIAGLGPFGGSDIGYRKPSNDAFGSAVALSGYSGDVEWGNVGATAQSGEPTHGDVSNTGSVWWTWTAPAKGTVEISTSGSDFDTVLAVYTGTAVGSLTKVAANDDHGGTSTSRVVFDTPAAGTVYRIVVAGYNSETGPIALSWDFEALNAATFTDMTMNAATGVAHVVFKARKGMSYKIQRASALNGSWSTVKTLTPTSTGPVAADVSIPTSWKSGFVRVVVSE